MQGADSAFAEQPDTAPSQLFCVLVTYRRPDELSHYLDLLATVAPDIAGVVVVDNDPGPTGAGIAAAASSSSLRVDYLASPDNLGPAGGVRLGLSHLARCMAPRDWIVLLDDDDPPSDARVFAAVHEFAEAQRALDPRVGMVGLGGARFDRRRARLVRVADEELDGPVDVDFVSGGMLPVVSAAAVRDAGPPDDALFFGMEEVDFGLRVKRHGYRIVADGPVLLADRRRGGRLGPSVPPFPRKELVWRRYYAVRNQIWLARRYGTRGAAARATAENVFGRPIADLRRQRSGWRSLTWLNVRGAFDVWTGRMGQRVDPADPRYGEAGANGAVRREGDSLP